jgi:hypothetical protein
MVEDARWARVQMWKPLREVLQAADAMFTEAARLRAAAEADTPAPPPTAAPPPTPAPPRPAAPARKPGPPPPPPPGAPAAYLRRRGELCDAITARLDPGLTDALGPWQKHMCVTVVVSFIDERERVALGGLADAWRLPLLQTQLLEIDDGGDRCFAQLQELLARADVHELVFEVYLLCLRAGFVGRYRDRRHELDKLIAWVVDRLRYYHPQHERAAIATAAPPVRPRIGFVGFPLRYYVCLVAAVAGLVLVLRMLSSREVSHSSLAEQCHFHERGAAP